MGVEIERKFLVTGDQWKAQAERAVRMRQGYLANTERASVRVRSDGDQADINIKSLTLGVHRREFEYSIPLAEADEMLDDLCMQPLIEKTRHFVRCGDHLWEVDVFEGENDGLVVAEVELDAVDEAFEKPVWAGAEVSDDPRYYNVCLIEHPFSQWEDRDRLLAEMRA